MKKFLDKIKSAFRKKKTPADAEQEIKHILSEGAESQTSSEIEENIEHDTDQSRRFTLGDSTNPNMIPMPLENLESAEIAEEEESYEEENVPFKEMKLGDVSQELTGIIESPEDIAIPDDVPPVPGAIPSHEGTQEIKIDPQQLQYLRENDQDFESDSEEEDISFKTMSLPKSMQHKGLKKWLDIVAKKMAPLIVLAREKFAKWQQQRIAQGRSELSWDKLVDDLYRVEYRPVIHRFFIATAVASAAYGMGKLTAFLIKGAEERVKPISASADGLRPTQYPLGAIKTANLFNTTIDKGPTSDGGKGTRKDKDFSKKICREANNGTALPLELTNTIVLQDSIKSVASVAIRGEKEILNVREGDNIQTMAQVGKIDRLKLIIKNLSSGNCEFIENKELQKQQRALNIVGEKEGKKLMQQFSSQDIQNEGNKFKIKKQFRDKMLENMGELLTQARAIQMKNPDGSLAFKMTEIIPGSIYSQLNIKDEDIISKINGKEISSLNDIMTMFGSIKGIDQLSITVMREGTEVEMEYRFE
jgi:type II secretory pathway component PulC